MSRHLGDLAAAFVDEQLDARARARAQRHVAACGRCAADVEAQQQVKQRLRGLPQPAVPGVLAARLLEVPNVEVPNASPPGHALPAGGAAGEGAAGQGAARLPAHVGTAGTAATPPRRPAAHPDRPPPRPSTAAGPRGKPGTGSPGRRRRPGMRIIVAGSASVLVLCMGLFGLAFALGGASPEPGPQVVPETPAYVAYHASVSNDRPLSDPALTTLTSQVLP